VIFYIFSYIFQRAAVSGGSVLPCCPGPVCVALYVHYVAFLDK